MLSFSGSPIRHIESARNGREKGGRWSISALFRKKSASTKGLGSEMVETTNQKPDLNHIAEADIQENNRLPDKSQITPETPPPFPPRASSRGRVGSTAPPTIFPHLKPEFHYPDPQPGSQGFYFHPNYGYVRRGSYSDHQACHCTIEY